SDYLPYYRQDTGGRVTMHQLLNHTSGIPSYTSLPRFFEDISRNPYTPEEFVKKYCGGDLEFEPGAKYKYNNSGYFLLGAIIEQVTGKKYEEVLRERILAPLGMADTGYDHHQTILKRRATGYAENCEGAYNSEYLDMKLPYAAGSLYATTEDLMKWNEAFFADRVVSAKSRELMTTPSLENYGYGLAMAPLLNRRAVSHGGGINGFSTYLLRFPEEKITIAVLRNATFGSPSPAGMTRDIAAFLFGEKVEIRPERTVAKIDPKLIDAYVGEYELAPEFKITMFREGACLMSQATGQPKVMLFPESDTKFFLKVVNAQVSFTKDAQGKVTGLTLHQGGAKPARKIK
ncbi:MAG: serine hydrolase, partial [Blastocatellia bacterium]